MDLPEALAIVCHAAENWCEYLDENDRESETDQIDEAVAVVRRENPLT